MSSEYIDSLANIIVFICAFLFTGAGALLGVCIVAIPGSKHTPKSKSFSEEEIKKDIHLRNINPEETTVADPSLTSYIPAQFLREYLQWQQGAISEQEALERCGLTLERFRVYTQQMQGISTDWKDSGT